MYHHIRRLRSAIRCITILWHIQRTVSWREMFRFRYVTEGVNSFLTPCPTPFWNRCCSSGGNPWSPNKYLSCFYNFDLPTSQFFLCIIYTGYHCIIFRWIYIVYRDTMQHILFTTGATVRVTRHSITVCWAPRKQRTPKLLKWGTYTSTG